MKLIPPKGHHLQLTDEVIEAFYAYGDALLEIVESQECTDLDGNYIRFPEKAIRIAALFASLSGSDSIEIKHWAKAQEITESWRRYLHEIYNQIITNVKPRKVPIPERVFRVILLKGNPSRRDIELHTGLKSVETQEALDKLIDRGEIREVPEANTIRYIAVTKITKDAPV